MSRRRTFAIISYPDAVKTTLTEKLLSMPGPYPYPYLPRWLDVE